MPVTIQNTAMDILPDRTNSHLSSYFREIDRIQRFRVKFLICDMWQPYVDIAQTGLVEPKNS